MRTSGTAARTAPGPSRGGARGEPAAIWSSPRARGRVTALALALALGLGVAACGATDTSSTSSGTGAGDGAPAPAGSSASTTGQPPATTGQAPATTAVAARTLFDFTDPSSVAGWYNQDDPVMGGRSRSGASWRDGSLVFAGDLSLENNGGFASVLSPRDDPIGARMRGANALVVRATGDGRTYVVQLRRADEPGAYVQRLATQAGVTRAYELPLAGFEPVDFMLRSRPDAPPLDPAALGQLAIYLTDKQEGPFGLAVQRIDATP